MPDNEREEWNQRYAESPRGKRDPDSFLVEVYESFIQPLFTQAGAALDVAGGKGRHAVYLAERGWRTTLADISEVAIDCARCLAAGSGVDIEFLTGDTRVLDFGRERFDVVLVFYYLEREIFPKLTAALRPGGLIVYKTFTREHEKFAEHRLTRPTYFFDNNELLYAFPGFRVLHYRESVRERGIAELVARKP